MSNCFLRSRLRIGKRECARVNEYRNCVGNSCYRFCGHVDVDENFCILIMALRSSISYAFHVCVRHTRWNTNEIRCLLFIGLYVVIVTCPILKPIKQNRTVVCLCFNITLRYSFALFDNLHIQKEKNYSWLTINPLFPCRHKRYQQIWKTQFINEGNKIIRRCVALLW